MSKGRRLAVVHQACLAWNADIDLQDFVQDGMCGEEDEVMPFNPALRTEIIKQFQGD